MKRPNFLVILTDQQRTDTVGSYGAPICRSPAVDRLAGAGTRFDNARISAPAELIAESSSPLSVDTEIGTS